MSEDDNQPSDFELIRESLLRMNPETCAEVIGAMKALRALPRPAAVRVLANAGMRAALHEPRALLAVPG